MSIQPTDQYTEHLAEIEHMIDGGASIDQVNSKIKTFDLSPDERDALYLWAWAWKESRPKTSRLVSSF